MLILDYFIRNIILALFTEVETYKIFSTMNEDWNKVSWKEVTQKLTQKSSWHTYRLKLHDKIINDVIAECRINSAKIEKLTNSKEPAVLLIRGATGAGKSTFIHNKLNITSGIVGGDLIRNKLKNSLFITARRDTQYDLESYFVTDKVLKSLLRQRISIVIERTIEYLEDFEMLCTLCQKYAYDSLHIVDLDASLEDSINRVAERNKDKNRKGPIVPVKYIERCVRNVMANRIKLIEDLKKEHGINIAYELFSNYGEKGDFKKVVEISKGNLLHCQPSLNSP